ncbi:MAG TPA: efflux RND transporter permease subunit [Candidatus Brocadiia bacterium]|nr:efflux RND transporter permease subunit [Candidatus Brocadiia bacterium]
MALKVMTDDLEDAIEAVPGVLKVDTTGTLEREIRLEFDPDRMASYGLTIPEIMQLIPSENVNISAGSLETPGTKFNVRVPAEFVSPEEVDLLLLTVRDGKPIYLSDVATVRDTFKDRESYSRLDGKPSASLLVRKRLGANILTVAAGVKMILDEARKVAPETVKFEIVRDFSKDIRMMVKDLENNIVSGLILVVAILLIFMGWRASFIVALVIPLSMLISFALLQAMGYTLNMIVLFSLILALGMLVDNAIVIVENIYRHRQLGCNKVEAAMKGTAEVAWPVTTSTLTTLAAFAPMLWWPGIMGDFMKYLPITLIVTLSASLLVALVVNPTVCATFGGRVVTSGGKENKFLGGYRRFLEFLLGSASHRFSALAVMLFLLVGLAMLFGKRGYGIEFFPEEDPDQVMVNIRCPQGVNITRTNELAQEVERRVEKYRGHMTHLLANVGSSGEGMIFGGGASGPNEAEVTMMFKDYEDRVKPSADIMKEARGLVADLAGAEIKVEKPQEGPPTGAAVTVRIVGKEFKELERLSEEAKELIADTPGLVNLRSDHEAARPELVYVVDRRAAMLNGVNTATVGNFIKTAVFGAKVGVYRQFNDEYDITVRLPLSQRVDIEDLLRLHVPNASGRAVPLSSLGRFEYRGGYGTINRVNQRRVVTLTGDAEGRLGPEVLADAQKRLEKLKLAPGYEIRYAGQKEEQDKASAFLTKAFVVACLLIVLILVAQFNTLTVPFIIMTTVILSLVGVFGGLLITRRPFGIIMTGIGVISLAGVVVNNAIVLLDYTRQLQARGMDLVAAAAQAGVTRLRPVFLTASTTVIGLIPMATGVSFDFHDMTWTTRSQSSQWWAGMAIAVIYGLSFATVLTLVVVPTLYVSLYRLAERLGFKSGVRGMGGEASDAPAAQGGGGNGIAVRGTEVAP